MPQERVFLTGATGFIGSHVLRALLDAGYPVRALVRPGSRLPAADGIEVVEGDVLRSGKLAPLLEGCDALIHGAGAYSFAPRDRSMLRAINVGGTRGILEAARIAGVRRAVVTSSSSTVGPMRNGRPATETDWAADERHSAYHASKIEQERAALAARLAPVLVLPTAPVGPGDHRPTPTGAMVLDFLRGRMVGAVDGGLNLVDVEDVAVAHVRALERGRPRERYLVGGENLDLIEVWRLLAGICDRKAPRLLIPHTVALAAGWADELRCRLLPDARPVAPLEGARMARHRYFVDDSKARHELLHRPRPVAEALERAVAWYRTNALAA
jgi:dihydroflavonol-4-reductase